MIEKVAYTLGRNDETPNIELALELIRTKNSTGISEIVDGLNNPEQQIANDCIKVLYEIGERQPSLISNHVDDFLKLLGSKNNRLVWGAMTALAQIASLKHQELFDNFDIIVKAYRNGSVITVDNSISVFAALIKSGIKYEKKILPILLNHLETCRPKEVAQHAERAFVCLSRKNAGLFKQILLKRYDTLTAARKKRIDKLLKTINDG